MELCFVYSMHESSVVLVNAKRLVFGKKEKPATAMLKNTCMETEKQKHFLKTRNLD